MVKRFLWCKGWDDVALPVLQGKASHAKGAHGASACVSKQN